MKIKSQLYIAVYLRIVILIVIFQTIKPAVFSQGNSKLPQLRRQGEANQLIVDDKPFLMLAGELGNSSASDTAYMRNIWPGLVEMNLNTILVPVYWELIEPKEGSFDFNLVDNTILSARKYGLKVVYLWFGSWKNSMSCYAPLWVKSNQDRFPLARKRDSSAVEILTPFSETNLKADRKAFIEFMKHIKKIDGTEHTIIMLQVENEIGMIPEARDYCDLANKAFNQAVPVQLIKYLSAHKEELHPELAQAWKENGYKTDGTWEQIFGKGLNTDEFFMAWHYASYAQSIAEAGKEVYPLPMYVNAALMRDGYKPGQYPSAGPLPHLMDIWKVGAPSIDFLSPDIYFKDFLTWVDRYYQSGNPLFIPEVGNDQSLSQAFCAIAQYNAIGYSPFSIESLANPENNEVTKAYKLLRQLSPLILANQGKGKMKGFMLDSMNQQIEVQLGDYIFTIKHEYSWPFAVRAVGETPRTGGMIIMLDPDEFIIAGTGVIVTFKSAKGDGTCAGIGSLDEGEFIDGNWMRRRRMNGDQSHQGRHLNLPGGQYSMQLVKLYTYK
jgi:hypothetical protein